MTETADPNTLEPLNVFVGEWSMADSFASNAADARVYVHQCSAASEKSHGSSCTICAKPVRLQLSAVSSNLRH